MLRDAELQPPSAGHQYCGHAFPSLWACISSRCIILQKGIQRGPELLHWQTDAKLLTGLSDTDGLGLALP